MDRIQIMIDEIKLAVPLKLLTRAFVPRLHPRQMLPSLEHTITAEILIKKILNDCDMMGGIQAHIDISNQERFEGDTYTIIDVGYGLTQGREIISVHSYTHDQETGQSYGAPTPISATTVESVTDNDIFVAGNNTVQISRRLAYTRLGITCVLANDRGFQNINLRLLPDLKDLAVLAVKAYIYSALVMEFSSPIIVGGTDYGPIKDLVDSYADARELYNDKLFLWRKKSYINDRGAYNRLIKLTTER